MSLVELYLRPIPELLVASHANKFETMRTYPQRLRMEQEDGIALYNVIATVLAPQPNKQVISVATQLTLAALPLW